LSDGERESEGGEGGGVRTARKKIFWRGVGFGGDKRSLRGEGVAKEKGRRRGLIDKRRGSVGNRRRGSIGK